MHGGIYEGPIGIVTRERYRSWWERVKDDRPKSNEVKFIDILRKIFVPDDYE